MTPSVMHTKDFYPRSPCGERQPTVQCALQHKHFYPRSPCGERPSRPCCTDTTSADFYPRSPCGERRLDTEKGPWPSRFLSTLSLRRATLIVVLLCHHINNFYPRSPCGERPNTGSSENLSSDFYPRSPCGERPNSETPTGGQP